MLPFFQAKRKKGWLSVVRRGNRFDLAHVVREGGRRPRVALCESFRIERDERDALQRLASARGLKAYTVTTLLAESDYRLLQIDAPSVPEEERVQAIRWRLKDMVDFPVATAALGVLDIPLEGAAAGRTPAVFAVIAPDTGVGQRQRLFYDARLALSAIDVPEMAVRNVAALFEENNRGLAFLGLVDGDSLLVITYRGELYFSRRMELSAVQLAEADGERRQQLLERLALELQRTLDNFDRQYGFISVARLVVASERPVPELLPALTESLYIPVQMMDLAAVLDFPAIPELMQPERQAQCLLALGAALREGA